MPAKNAQTETFQIKSRKPARESVGLFADKRVKGALRDDKDKVKKLSYVLVSAAEGIWRNVGVICTR